MRKKSGDKAFQLSLKFPKRRWDQRLAEFNKFSNHGNTELLLLFSVTTPGSKQTTVDEEFHPAKSGACGYYLIKSQESKFILFDKNNCAIILLKREIIIWHKANSSTRG